jgi:alpha-tubulin suppressor-like RCC1 family protein
VTPAAGGCQSAALDGMGMIWVWGGHLMGRGGPSGKARYSPVPFKVDGLPPIVAVACGESHALALDKNGYVWTWGAKARSPEKIPGLNLLR